MAGNQGPDKQRPGLAGLPISVLVVMGILVLNAVVAVLPFMDPSLSIRDAGGFAGGGSYGGGGGGGGGGGYGGGSGSGGSGSDAFDLVMLFFALPIAYMLGTVFWTKGDSQPAGAERTPDSQLRAISELQERDPGFSASEVEDLYANVYVRMQQCWTAGDFEPMRPYFSKQLFAQFSSQLKALRDRGQTNYVDNIAVLETTVRGWFETFDSEYLVMKVRTRITDYTLEDSTGKLVGGFRDRESFMEYEYQLVRAKGVKSSGFGVQTVAEECPNCGAAIDLAQNALCPYCGSVVESKRHTWVIAKIKGISQQVQSPK